MSDAGCRILETGWIFAIFYKGIRYLAWFLRKVCEQSLDAEILTQGTKNYGTR
jgi:hypothetical protein